MEKKLKILLDVEITDEETELQSIHGRFAYFYQACGGGGGCGGCGGCGGGRYTEE